MDIRDSDCSGSAGHLSAQPATNRLRAEGAGIMNVPPRGERIWLHAELFKKRKAWNSILGAALACIPLWRTTRVIVRLVSGGFTAELHLPYRKEAMRVHWHEEMGSWQPEAYFRRLARFASERSVDLELPQELTLEQSVTLPRAALTNLSEAIVYGLPSWSPFEAHEIYVKGRVDQLQPEHARIRLHYALKAKADPLLARLSAAGLPADQLILNSASNQLVTLSTPKLARLQRARRIDGALAIMAISFVLLLGSLRVTTLSQKLDEAERLLRTELAQLRQAEALQAAYASFALRQAAVSERRANEVSAYELLAVLGQHLPEDTLIQALEVGNARGQLDLSGVDPEATLDALRLIPAFRNLRIEPTGGQGVTITFEVNRKRP